ncbi:exonuclease domain-containing protein [Curvibacter sp. APW13]|uniref:exonuclease domain-containing protein n=1 Tax=Curvibacter sp. APW13 TaxID=3077236 RepID=UPI0028DF1E90|nr:exonuclease domain-containing protein [Curvibacter sp. APW13]MDT8991791.1 exonuclease domain-containing protein [Curvibacter sp. APW13]
MSDAPAMLPCYVMLDLETTGGSAEHDRITEIAMVRVEDGTPTQRWSSLVNPGKPIPPFIESLTGISDAMVADAPPFAELLPRVQELLHGAVLVAHNVRFDHGFLAKEMERAGALLNVQTLCTVRLSRRLYPHFKGHGLDALSQRHGLLNEARHRAMGDVDAVLAWLDIATRELGAQAVQAAAQSLLQGNGYLPAHLQTPLTDLPEGPGAYVLRNAQGQAIYVGKAAHLRQRVLKHIQSAKTVAKDRELTDQTVTIDAHPTAGELGALIERNRLVAQLQPHHNRLLKRERATLEFTLATLPAWPLSAPLAIREYHPGSERSAVHVFDQWRWLGSAQSEEELQQLDLHTERAAQRPFDVEVFRVLQKRLPTLKHDPHLFLWTRTTHGEFTG